MSGLRLEAVKKVQAERHLAHFVRQAWPLLEPATPLVWGKHLDAICLHLEAVSAGRIPNLVINCPPGCLKSTVVAVCWPVWHWVRRPADRFITASYAAKLAVRDAVRSRRVIEGDWFQANWGDRFQLSGDMALKLRYENDRTGYRLTTSPESGTTGERANVVVVDDPHDVKKADSAAYREAVLRWHDESLWNRVNDPARGGRVIIGQRTHAEDLFAHVRKKGLYEFLELPEEYEPHRHCKTSVGWEDWRTEPGELLRPKIFGPEQIKEAKYKSLGTFAYSAQHQQSPTPREGALYKAKWFKSYVSVGDFGGTDLAGSGWAVRGSFVPCDRCRLFAVADPAGGTSDSADHTAVVLFALTPDADLLVLDVFRERVPLEEIVPRLAHLCVRWRPEFLAIEKGFFQNSIVRQALKHPGMPPVRAVDPGGKSKLARSLHAVIRAEAGQVWLPEEADWLPQFMEEILAFTGSGDDACDDQADCLSMSALLVEQLGGLMMSGSGPIVVAKKAW